MSQQSRRHDPYPWTWEIPAVVTVVFLTLLVGAVHVGRAMANLVVGAAWAFPPRVRLLTSLPTVVRGDAGAGLDGRYRHLASPEDLWAWVAVTELTVICLNVWLLNIGLHRWGPRRIKGMATRAEAERLLGLTRLRKNSTVIRPDLYGRDRHKA